MRQTKKIAISGLLVALGTVIMALGAVLEVVDLTSCALASLLVAFVYIEIGSPYTWLVWLCTSLTTFICFSGSLVWAEYLFVFGVYPLLKAFIEKLPRVFWILIKFAYINGVIWLLFLVARLLGMSLFNGETLIINIALYAIVNIAFFAYDMFITVLVRLYFDRFRKRFKRFLK